MNQHYKKLLELHKRYLRCYQEVMLIRQDSLCKLKTQVWNTFQQGKFLNKMQFVIHLLRPMFLQDSLCKKMLQLENTFQGHKCRYKMRLLIQLLLPTFQLHNQYMSMHLLMHTFQLGRLYIQQLDLFLHIRLCLDKMVDIEQCLHILVHK